MAQLELKVAMQLKKWFENYGIKCWLNQGDDKFQTKKSQKKPDLIIFSAKINQYVAIEIKKGNISKEIYDASKIIEYWQAYEQGQIEYYIKDKQIQISSFAVATLYSMFVFNIIFYLSLFICLPVFNNFASI